MCACVRLCLSFIKVKLAIIVEGDLKAHFSISTTLWWKEGATRFPGLLHFIFDPYLIVLSVKQSTIFWVFSMTRPETEPMSPGPLANTIHSARTALIICFSNIVFQLFNQAMTSNSFLALAINLLITYIFFFSFFFIIQRVKARAIPCPHQPPTRYGHSWRYQAAFATGQGI